MDEKPLLSIITVNLNDKAGLERTMTSVYEQTWQEFEHIIIDGGSTDGSREYIESFENKIAYWVSEKDSGIYNAMNKGIKVANGEYLLFLNSGDHFNDRIILEQNKAILNSYDLIYFNIKVVSDKMEYIKNSPANLSFSYFNNDTLPHQATYIKASLFKKVGCYDENFLIVSDWKFFLESICHYDASYLKLEEILSTHYLNGVSAVPENWPVILEERKKVLESGFKAYIGDSRELIQSRQKIFELQNLISTLRNSKKIRLLVKLGLLRKF